MRPLSEIVTEVDEVMMALKTDWVTGEPDSTDLLTYVHLYRGDQLVATLQSPMDRDTMLQACWVAAIGMVLDAIVVTFESWHSTLKECPVTNAPWEPGEMAFLGATSAEAREKGWVNECLTTMAWDRDKNNAMLSRPYIIKGTEVTYLEPQRVDSTKPGNSSGGFVNDEMLNIMAQPSILDRLQTENAPQAQAVKILGELMSEEEKIFHLDCAALKAMSDRKVIESAVLMAEEGSDRQRMIEERFGDSE